MCQWIIEINSHSANGPCNIKPGSQPPLTKNGETPLGMMNFPLTKRKMVKLVNPPTYKTWVVGVVLPGYTPEHRYPK